MRRRRPGRRRRWRRCPSAEWPCLPAYERGEPPVRCGRNRPAVGSGAGLSGRRHRRGLGSLADLGGVAVGLRSAWADTGVVSAEQVTREEVVAFLGGQPGTAEGLEALAGGAWSSAWAYRAGGEELVV